MSNAAARDSRFRKTQLCSFFREGRCRFGDDCSFAHTPGEIEYAPDLAKTALCKLWKAGTCTLSGKQCRFAHGIHELREKSRPNKGPPESHVPAPMKLERRPISLDVPAKAGGAERWEVPEPMMITPSSAYTEQLQLAMGFASCNSKSFEPTSPTLSTSPTAPTSPSARSMKLSRWDPWDCDTAAGDTSSDDGGSCPSVFYESERSIADLYQQVPVGMILKAPPGLEDMLPPPGLEEFSRRAIRS